jgi:hypothetical protein
MSSNPSNYSDQELIAAVMNGRVKLPDIYLFSKELAFRLEVMNQRWAALKKITGPSNDRS